MVEKQDRENAGKPQSNGQEISCQIQLFVKNECDKARNQAIGVLGFVALLLTLIGGFGLNSLIKSAVTEAVKEAGLEGVRNKAEGFRDEAEGFRDKAENYMQDTLRAKKQAQQAAEAAEAAEFGKPDYVSDWKLVNKGDELTLYHGLGQIPKLYTVFVAKEVKNDQSPQLVYLGNQIWHPNNEHPGRGIMLTDITVDELVVKVGRKYLYDSWPAGDKNKRVNLESGYVKLHCWK